MKRHFLITGLPGCGKTTFIKRLAEHFSGRHPIGFFTEEIRVKGVRRGFRLSGLNGKEGLLAFTQSYTYAVGKPPFSFDLATLMRRPGHYHLTTALMHLLFGVTLRQKIKLFSMFWHNRKS